MAIKKTSRSKGRAEKRKLKEVGSLQRMGKALGFPKEDPIIDDDPHYDDHEEMGVPDAEISDVPMGGTVYSPKPVRGWRRID